MFTRSIKWPSFSSLSDIGRTLKEHGISGNIFKVIMEQYRTGTKTRVGHFIISPIHENGKQFLSQQQINQGFTALNQTLEDLSDLENNGSPYKALITINFNPSWQHGETFNQRPLRSKI